MRALAIDPILKAAALWELDGPRITGPMTSFSMLGMYMLVSPGF